MVISVFNGKLVRFKPAKTGNTLLTIQYLKPLFIHFIEVD